MVNKRAQNAVLGCNFKKEQNEKEKSMALKEKLPRSVGAQYAIGEEWRNNSSKNEETEPKRKQHPVVDITGDGSPML